MNDEERDELLIRLDENTKTINKDIKTIKKTLFGNGKEGLIFTMERHRVYFALIGAVLIVTATAVVKLFV